MGYFERFVSRRYLFTRQQRLLVSFISLISIAGVAVGVGALMIVLGVIDGIDRDIFSKIVEIYPHVKVMDADGHGLSEPERILSKITARDEVKQSEPVISKQVLFMSGTARDDEKVPGVIIGVDRLGKDQLYDIRAQGGQNIELADKEIVVSWPLGAHKLGLRPGESVVVTTGNLVKAGGTYRPRMRQLHVIGYFQSGLHEFDQDAAFISSATARDLFGMERAADYLHVRVKDPFAVRSLKSSLESELGPDYKVVTWEEENGEFFQALKLEKFGLFTILLLVVIVASFNIIGTLILMVIQKTREIGILKAIGASDRMVHRTFMNAGLTIGVIGTAAGFVLGMIGYVIVKNFRFDLPPSVLAFDRLPIIVKPLTVAIIMACSIAISLLAALFPATQAAKLNPVEALRHD